MFYEKPRLRKLFTKGPDFREPHSLNYSGCKKEIDCAVEEFSGSYALKHKIKDTIMELWVKKVKQKVKNNNKLMKKSKQIYNTSPVLQDEEIRQYLKDLQT